MLAYLLYVLLGPRAAFAELSVELLMCLGAARRRGRRPRPPGAGRLATAPPGAYGDRRRPGL